MKPFQIYLASLIIINLIFSSYIAYTSTESDSFCILGKGCSEVQNSEYGKIAGVPLSIIGIFSFFFLLVFYIIFHKKYQTYKIYLIAAFLGALSSIYFLSVQFFILKKICSTCIVIDVIMIIIFALSFYEFNKLRKGYNFL